MALINKSQVKAFFRRNGMRVSEDVYDPINLELERLLQKAIERATGSRRGTVLRLDL